MFLTYQDIMVLIVSFIVTSLGIAVLILLIVALVKLINTVSKVNKLLDDNAEDINKTVKKLPALTESIDKTLTNVNGTIDEVNGTFFDSKSSVGTVTNVADIVETIANVIINLLAKRN